MEESNELGTFNRLYISNTFFTDVNCSVQSVRYRKDYPQESDETLYVEVKLKKKVC